MPPCMRVTDEMVERFLENLAQGPIGDRADARAVLEATLEHVNEPQLEAAEYRRLWTQCCESRNAACERADAAEAKLAALREELDQNEPMNDPDWRRTLRAILDE